MSPVLEAPPAGSRRRAFVAMGCDVELLLEGPAAEADEGLAAAEREIHRLETILSRFLPTSALSTLNRDRAVDGPPELTELTRAALDARERTGGRFDPTVHDAVVAAGYDRTFDALALEDDAAPGETAGCGGEIHVDGTSVALGPGVSLDLGGIAKGYAADRACGLMAEIGPCLANLGGDVAVRGAPAAGAWAIAVDVPGEPLTLGLTGGGLATSGRDVRRWRRGDLELHHLIDPVTGAPSTSTLLRVTAYAESAMLAEVAAKALFLAGEKAAREEADALGLPAVLVTDDGRVIRAGGLA